MIMYKNAKGFTFVELIVATVILAIVVAGVYAAFLSAAKFMGTFRHKVMAVIGAQGWLGKKQAKTIRYSDLVDAGFTDIPTADLYMWGGTFTGLRSEVDNLDGSHLPQYEISEEKSGNFGTLSMCLAHTCETTTLFW